MKFLVLSLFFAFMAVGKSVQAAKKWTYVCVGTIVDEREMSQNTEAKQISISSDRLEDQQIYFNEVSNFGNSRATYKLESHEGQIGIEVFYFSNRHGGMTARSVAAPGGSEISLHITPADPSGRSKGSASLSCDRED